MREKTVLGVTLEKLLGIVIFLLILAVLNIIQFDSMINTQIVEFLNQNLSIIIIFSILFYLGELFSIFLFPLNIPSPIFNAMGGIFLVGFIFQIFYMVGVSLDLDAFIAFRLLEPLVIALVFLLVIIVGYVKILINIIPKDKEEEKKQKPKKNKVEWDDVGNELKMAAYNLASTIKERLEPKKSKNKK